MYALYKTAQYSRRCPPSSWYLHPKTPKCSTTRQPFSAVFRASKRPFSVVFCKSKRPYSSVLVKVFILPNGLVRGVPCRVERDVTQVTTSSRFLHILGLEINDKRKTGGHTSTSTAHMFLLPSFLRSRRVCEVWWWLSAATSSALIGAVSQCDQDDMMHVTLVAATKYPRNINLKLHQKVLKYHN